MFEFGLEPTTFVVSYTISNIEVSSAPETPSIEPTDKINMILDPVGF